MTETPVEEPTVESEAEEAPEPVHCRHCGQPIDLAADADPNAEAQCQACERYQDTMPCPTCSQPARISLLPAELVPAPHAPARRRRSPGG